MVQEQQLQGKRTYHDGPLSPSPVPVTTDITDPVSLSPDPGANADLRIQLHAHLKVPLKRRFWNLQRAADTRVALESAGDHGIVVSLLMGLVAATGGGVERSWGGTVDGFMQDGVLGIVFFHSREVVGAFEEVSPLAGGILCTDRLAINTLRGETLCDCWVSTLIQH